MVDRRTCTHPSTDPCVLIVRWCVRCSGWQAHRCGVHSGSFWAPDTPVPYESHFLPIEETNPDELLALIQRCFRSAQEWEQDAYELRRL